MKTCSQALKRRSVAFGTGSGSVEIQTIAANVVMHKIALIHRSSLNIGLTVRRFDPPALGMLPSFFVVNLARVQVDDR